MDRIFIVHSTLQSKELFETLQSPDIVPRLFFANAHPNTGRTAFPPRSYTDREQNMTVTRRKNSPA